MPPGSCWIERLPGVVSGVRRRRSGLPEDGIRPQAARRKACSGVAGLVLNCRLVLVLAHRLRPDETTLMPTRAAGACVCNQTGQRFSRWTSLFCVVAGYKGMRCRVPADSMCAILFSSFATTEESFATNNRHQFCSSSAAAVHPRDFLTASVPTFVISRQPLGLGLR